MPNLQETPARQGIVWVFGILGSLLFCILKEMNMDEGRVAPTFA